MKREAEANAESDKKKQELITSRNTADNLIYTAQKAMRDAGAKLPADAKKSIDEKIENLKKVKDGDSIEDIKAKTDDLSQTLSKAGAQLYQQPGAGQGQQGSAGSGQGSQGGQPGGSDGSKDAGPQEGEFKEK